MSYYGIIDDVKLIDCLKIYCDKKLTFSLILYHIIDYYKNNHLTSLLVTIFFITSDLIYLCPN